MEDILRCFMKEGNAEMIRQIEFIIKQLNSGLFDARIYNLSFESFTCARKIREGLSYLGAYSRAQANPETKVQADSEGHIVPKSTIIYHSVG